jgi:UDP-glucuronate 4-epimerase
MSILVTGAAGFIGFHLCVKLLRQGRKVVGLDNLNDYYDVRLKEARLNELRKFENFHFAHADLSESAALDTLFSSSSFHTVINLAAQAGVRYSLINPQAYVRSNVEGFVNVLESCRKHGISHLIYASSSSVYGAVTKMPFSVHQPVDHPVSLYGATKKANELLAHSYSHLFQLPTTGVRFFTVYGPWGRPDMAMFIFARAILANEPIQIFNHGKMQRDFTYVDDIVEGLARLMDRIPSPDLDWNSESPDPGSSSGPYRVYNIGNSRPENLLHVVELLEQSLGRKAVKQFLPMQLGDVPATYADVDDLERDVGFTPQTPIATGVERFVQWYRDYYRV